MAAVEDFGCLTFGPKTMMMTMMPRRRIKMMMLIMMTMVMIVTMRWKSKRSGTEITRFAFGGS